MQLTPDEIAEAWAGAWSPDGSRIAYMGFVADSSEVDFNLYVAYADGTESRRITDNPGSDGWPLWSRDGSEVYFRTQRGETNRGDWDIAVVSAEGGDARVLLDTPEDEDNLFWAGDRLLFTRLPIGNTFVTVDVGELLGR